MATDDTLPAGLPVWLDVRPDLTWRELIAELPNDRSLLRKLRSHRVPASEVVVTTKAIAQLAAVAARDVEAIDWAAVGSNRLVALFFHAFATDLRVQLAVPAEFGALTQRRTIFLRCLTHAFVYGERIGVLPKNAAASEILNILVLWWLAEPAWTEIDRRGRTHEPSFAAAILRWFMQIRRDGITADNTGLLEAWAVRRLGASARCGTRNRGVPREQLDDLIGPNASFGLVAETVDKDLGPFDPIEAINNALVGKFDYVPIAIANALSDQLRSARQWLDRRSDQDVERLGLTEDPQTVGGLGLVERARGLLGRLRSRRARAALKLLRDDRPIAEQARDARVSQITLKKSRAKALKTLRLELNARLNEPEAGIPTRRRRDSLCRGVPE